MFSSFLFSCPCDFYLPSLAPYNKHFSISILRTNMMPKQFQLCAPEGRWLIFDNNNGSSTVDKDNIFTIKCLFAWLIVGTALTSLLRALGKKITIEKCRETHGSSGTCGLGYSLPFIWHDWINAIIEAQVQFCMMFSLSVWVWIYHIKMSKSDFWRICAWYIPDLSEALSVLPDKNICD